MCHYASNNHARYVDITCLPMGTTESLFDYVLQAQNSSLDPDRLYRCARLWGRCYWGKQYPDKEVADDMENYRGLELLHEGMMLRYKLWKAFLDGSDSTGHGSESLFAEMMAVRDVRNPALPTTPRDSYSQLTEILRPLYHR